MNSQVEKGERLSKLLARLKDLWKSRDNDQLASILSLLLHLSDSPLKSEGNYTDTPTVKESVDRFIEESKAAAILQDLEDYSDVPDWGEEDSDSEEDPLSSDSEDVEMQEIPAADLQENQRFEQMDLTSSPDSVIYGALPEAGSYHLSTVSVSQSATPKPLARAWVEPASTLAEYYAETEASYLVFSPATEVSERALITDILSMLLGIDSDYFLFDKGYRLRSKVEVTHLTPQALEAALSPFCKLASGLRKLKDFSEQMKSSGSLVFRSFAQGIDLFLYRETAVVNTLAAQAAVQAGVVPTDSIPAAYPQRITLISLWNALRKTNDTIHLILSIIYYSVTEIEQSDKASQLTPAYRASYLLSYLYYLLQENAITTDPDSTHISATLFHTAVHPMVGLLCDWVASGGATEHEEFLADFDCAEKKTEFEVWNSAFQVKVVVVDGEKVRCCPSFLESMTDSILTLAKTMRVIKKLEEEVSSAHRMKSSFYSLKEQMFARLIERLGVIPGSCYSTTDLVEWKPGNERRKCLPDLEFPTEMHSLYASPAAFPSPYMMEVEEMKVEVPKPALFPRTREYAWTSFSEVIKYCIGDSLEEAYKEAVSHLLALLTGSLGLEHAFSLIRSIYLMESGEYMTPFLNDIFAKLERDEVLDNTFDLNLSFAEVLQGWKWAASLDALRFVLEGEPQPAIMLEATQHLQLHYDPPSLLELIFDRDTMQKYERLFSFLIQVKRAIYSISDTKWQDKASKQPHLHLFTLFQRELRHFIHSFEVYLFQQILSVGALKFQSSREKAGSVDEVRSLHQGYLEKMIERCLLGQKALPIYKAVGAVFECCIRFRHLVRKVAVLTPAVPDYEAEVRDCKRNLEDLKEHFKRSNWFLIQILSKQAQRKQAVHCKCHLVMGAYCSLNFNQFYLPDSY